MSLQAPSYPTGFLYVQNIDQHTYICFCLHLVNSSIRKWPQFSLVNLSGKKETGQSNGFEQFPPRLF